MKLLQWQLTHRERVLALWLVRLSYLSGRRSVWIARQTAFSELTGIDLSDVGDALRSLERKGVIQRRGDRLGRKEYTFLPNAELVEPDARVPPQRLAGVLAEIEEDNAHGPGCEPGGQLRAVELEPVETRLACDVAQASAERAVESDETGFVPWSPEWVRFKSAESLGLGKSPSEVGELPSRVGESPSGFAPDGRERVRAPDTLTCTNDHDHVALQSDETRTKVRTEALKPAGNAALATRAFRAVWEVIPKAEFDPWQRRWKERCDAHPDIVLAWAEDCKDRIHRAQKGSREPKITSPGGYIFRMVKKTCSERGLQFR
jgi:hypothetical protein